MEAAKRRRLCEIWQILYNSKRKFCLGCLRGDRDLILHTCVTEPDEPGLDNDELLSEVLALISYRDLQNLTYELNQLTRYIRRKSTRQTARRFTIHQVPTRPGPESSTSNQTPLPDAATNTTSDTVNPGPSIRNQNLLPETS